jgi:hypothetical protein
MDSYDHLIEADLKHSAALVASFVYNAAQRDEKLPRKKCQNQHQTKEVFKSQRLRKEPLTFIYYYNPTESFLFTG